jgi:hypothetical protein
MKGHSKMQRTLGRTVAALFTAAVASAALASSASAGVLTQSATDCDDGALTQPFARFGDGSEYKLVDNGSFEDGTDGWTLTGGAAVASGNESYRVGGAGDDKSLKLPGGSTATTPFVCVGTNEPTLRLFAKRNSALLGLVSTLQVQIQVQTSLGLTAWLPVLPGDLGGSSWHPTVTMPFLVNLLTLGDRTPVRFRFTPLLGSWQIDDVYVDPARMR